MTRRLRPALRYTVFKSNPLWLLLRKNVQIWSFFCPYFPVFSLNTGKWGPGKRLQLDMSHAVYKQPTIKCSELATETLEQGVKYVQS